MKAQWIRVLDVALIGPVMMAGGRSLSAKRPRLGGALMLFGFGTMIYNAHNWIRVESVQGPPLAALPSAAEGVEIEEV